MTDQTSIRDMLFYKSIFYITGVNAKIAASNSFTIVKRARASMEVATSRSFSFCSSSFSINMLH